MSNFNYDEYDNLINSRDYLGAANYMSKFRASTPEDQIKANNLIRQLKREGEIRAARLSKMTDEQRQAYDFFSAMEGKGTIPHTIYDEKTGQPKNGTSNMYGDKYTSYINNIKTSDGKDINTLKFNIANDETMSILYKTLGVNDITANQKYGIDIYKDNKTGKYSIAIDKHNSNLMTILNVLDDNPIASNSFVTGFYKISPYTVEGLDNKGNSYKLFAGHFSNIERAKKIYNDAKDEQEEVLNALEPKNTLYKTTVSPFLGAGQANAYKRYQRGEISFNDYTKIVKERTEIYNTLIKQAGLTQYDVYATEIGNEDKGEVLEKTDNITKNQLEKALLVGMDEGRVTYSAAIVAGRTGTYITIAPKADNKGNYMEGDAAKPMRLFIPGLFQSSCDETFENDTKTTAMRDMADIQTYQYAKQLHDGTAVGYDERVGFYKQMVSNGKLNIVPVDEEEVLASLNRQNIIDKSADQLISSIGADGKPLTRNVNGVETPYDISAMGKLLASAGTQELFDGIAIDKGTQLQEENNIYNDIMNILNNFYANYNTNN